MENSKELAKKHFQLMLKMGAEVHEITRCLSESKKKLILAKAKADNLPKKADQARQFITSLNPKALDVIREWFRLNVTFDKESDVIAALSKLTSTAHLLEDDEKDEDARQLWRQIFKAYVSTDCPRSVVDFIRGSEESQPRPAPYLKIEKKQGNSVVEEIAPINKLDSKIDKKITLPIYRKPPKIQPAQQKAIDENTSTRKLTTIPLLTAQEIESTNKEIDLKTETSTTKMKGAVIRRALSQIPARLAEPHECHFLGTVKRILDTGQIFVHVECLYYEEELIELSPDQAKKIFPTLGDVTAFRSTMRGTYREGESGIWTADLGNTDKGTHYVIEEHISRVFDVISLPHASTEPDKVRNWLHKIYRTRIGIAPIFLLNDGLLLRIPGDTNDPGKHNFDTPIDGYWMLEATRLSSGRIVVVKPLPAPDAKYDCASQISLIKRLIKHKASSELFPSFTKGQINALVDFASSMDGDSSPLSVLRAKEMLLDVEVMRDLLEDFIIDLLDLQVVQEGIESQKKKVIEAFEGEMSALTQEIADLRRQKEAANKELEKQKQLTQAEIAGAKKKIHQQELELGKRIKVAFERASQEGVEVLAQSTLFKAILAGESKNELTKIPTLLEGAVLKSELFDAKNPVNPMQGKNGQLIKNTRELLKAIQRISASEGLSESMLVSVVASSIASPVIGLIGSRVRKLIKVLSAIISDSITCEVSITGDMFGISDLFRSPALIRSGDKAWSTTFGDFLETQQDCGKSSVIELRGINRVPPESFLPELIDFQIETGQAAICWIDERKQSRIIEVRAPTIFVITFVEGRSTFPIEGLMLETIPIVQVDDGWMDQYPPDKTIEVINSQVRSDIWAALQKHGISGDDIDQEQSSVGSRFISAACALGFSSVQSAALEFLVFKSGRVPENEIQTRIELDCPEFLPYAKVITNEATRRLLSHVVNNYGRIPV